MQYHNERLTVFYWTSKTHHKSYYINGPSSKKNSFKNNYLTSNKFIILEKKPTLLKKKLTNIIISVSICLLIGFLSSFATQSSVNTWYATLEKPFFNPPNWLFAPVWSILYVLMGVSAGIVWSKGMHHIWVKTALYHFGFQLLLNAAWSIVFFGLREPFWAFMVIVMLLILLGLTIRWFHVVNKIAAYLLVPYFLWVCFASALNYKIWELN